MIVSNSSTLILLSKISLLRKFLENSPKIIIPEEVEEEILNSESFDAKVLQKEIQEKKIVVKKGKIKGMDAVIKEFHLDIGEAAAFCIFNEKEHSAILTDDKELMKVCKICQIQFACAMGIVLRMYELKQISKDDALKKMEHLKQIGRYSDKLYDHYINEVEKNGNNVSKA